MVRFFPYFAQANEQICGMDGQYLKQNFRTGNIIEDFSIGIHKSRMLRWQKNSLKYIHLYTCAVN